KAGAAGAAAAAAGIAAGARAAAGAGAGAQTTLGLSRRASGTTAGAEAAEARGREGDEILHAARKYIERVEDAIAEAVERHPDEMARVSAAMEKLGLAREFLGEGDGEAALQFATEARAALGALTDAASVGKGAAGALMCPSCGEPLEPEWTVCPACGHGTR
ncbi:MAG: zinc ribbon domain-containing protein, partial [Thermoplasmata archaeon]